MSALANELSNVSRAGQLSATALDLTALDPAAGAAAREAAVAAVSNWATLDKHLEQLSRNFCEETNTFVIKQFYRQMEKKLDSN